MAKLGVIEGVIVSFEAPEVAAHLLERLKVRFFRQFKLLLQVDYLLFSFDLEKLSLWHFNHNFVTVRSRDFEIFLEYVNQVLNFLGE